jgi:hypothetical protein
MRVLPRPGVICILAMILAAGSSFRARNLRADSSVAVPPKLQVAILSRMLAYDRTFKSRVGNTVRIGVVVRAGDKASTAHEAAMAEAFKDMDPPLIQGLPVVVVQGHAYNDPAAFQQWIEKDDVSALYVSTGLAEQVDVIGAACVQKKIVSMTGTRSYVEKALAVGVVVKGENPKILVNLKTAEAIGMSLDSKLLQLSEVIR